MATLKLLTALAAAAVLPAPATARAETPDSLRRPVTSTYSVEAGRSRMFDTYLSPLRYDGVRVGLSGEWQKMMPASPRHLLMQMDASLSSAFDRNPARSTTMYDFTARFSWGMLYTLRFSDTWSAGFGGTIGFTAGAAYLPVNGNNPANADVDVMLSLRAQGAYRFTLWGRSFTLRDRVTVPTVGAMFSPGFGESYYEIYLGNRSGLAHAAWWGNHFCIDNRLSLTFPLAGRQVTAGYRFSFASRWVNNLSSRRVSHSFTIGLTFGPHNPGIR